MNALNNRNPFADFDNLFRSAERNLESLWRGATSGIGGIAMDVYERADALYVRAALPGARQEDVEVLVERNILTIKGVIPCDYESPDTKVYLLETPYGHFTRSVRIPENINAEGVEAAFDRGVLTIRIPKNEKPTNVRVIPLQKSLAADNLNPGMIGNIQNGEHAESVSA